MSECSAFLHDVRTMFDLHWSTISVRRSSNIHYRLRFWAFAFSHFRILGFLSSGVHFLLFCFLTRPWLKDETSSFFLSWLKVETFLDKWSNSSSFFSLSELTRLQLLCDLDYTITAWPDIWLDYATVNESSFVLPPWLGEVCLFSLGYVCIWTEAPFPNKVFSLTKVSVVLYSPVLTAPLTTWLYPVRKTIICYLFGLCIWSYRLDSPLCGNSSFSHRAIRALMLIL